MSDNSIGEDDFLGSFDSGVNADDFDGVFSQSSDDQPDNCNEAQGSNETKAISKTAAMCIGASVIILMVAFAIVNASHKKNVQSSSKSTNNEQVSSNVEKTDETSDWQSVSDIGDISIGKEISAVFTVTDVRNFVKFVNSNNDFELKTVVTGNLSGFTGSYELNIPFSKGSKLNVGDTFDVGVQIGNYHDKTVVCEIKY